MMNDEFIRNRITELRLKKQVSEYQMSYDLGHSRGYINNITSGKVLPSMSEFLYICEYFQISPAAFFDQEQQNPELISKAVCDLKMLPEEDVLFVLDLINRLKKNIKKS